MTEQKKLKPVILKISNKEYKLEYSRASVQYAESLGLRLDEIISKPATNLPILFHASFMMNHPEIGRNESENIITKLNGLPSDLISKLIMLYNEPINSLINNTNDSVNGTEKNGQYVLEVP